MAKIVTLNISFENCMLLHIRATHGRSHSRVRFGKLMMGKNLTRSFLLVRARIAPTYGTMLRTFALSDTDRWAMLRITFLGDFAGGMFPRSVYLIGTRASMFLTA